MGNKVQRIEINFPATVEMPSGFEHIVMSYADAICSAWEAANKGKVMWAAGVGAKVIWKEPEEPDYDDSVFCIDCAMRDESPKEKDKRERLETATAASELDTAVGTDKPQ